MQPPTCEGAAPGAVEQAPAEGAFARPGSGRGDPSGLQGEALRRLESYLAAGRRTAQLTLDGERIIAAQEDGCPPARYAYNAAGDLSEIVEPSGRRTGFAYDAARRLTRVDHGSGTTRYTYDARGYLAQTENRGTVARYEHDMAGRLSRVHRGNAGAIVYRYDGQGRVYEGRTAAVSTRQAYDAAGRVVSVAQTLAGVTTEVRLAYDQTGRLAEMVLPGSACPVVYGWDEHGRLASVGLGTREIAHYEYRDDGRAMLAFLANGIVETTTAEPVDGRPARRRVMRGGRVLFERSYGYAASGRVAEDGTRRYEYDALGRLVEAQEPGTGAAWRYEYDAEDNRTAAHTADGTRRFLYDELNRLVAIEGPGDATAGVEYDRLGRPMRQTGAGAERTYLFDDASELLEMRERGVVMARCGYDHDGRPAWLRTGGPAQAAAERGAKRGAEGRFESSAERYLYGPRGELLAVTDMEGRPRILYVRTPAGLLAEVHGPLDSGPIYFRHHDIPGSCWLITDGEGEVAADLTYDPYGAPGGNFGGFAPEFGGHLWRAAFELYDCGARWYDPALGRFLTPDSYTGRPDDARLMAPYAPAMGQVFRRAEVLADWLARPRVRNPYAYCGNDPVGRLDPDGHWDFGWWLLSMLGVLWALPNTLLGIAMEILLLVGEVVRWIVYAFSGGHASWQTPGFDAAASSRLHSFALVFTGGWLGSLPNFGGIAFGNTFFVNKDYRETAEFGGPGNVFPSAYGGQVSIPRTEALYEHELRHVHQQYLLGPLYWFLPPPGLYLWFLIFGGRCNAWMERDARAYSGV